MQTRINTLCSSNEKVTAHINKYIYKFTDYVKHRPLACWHQCLVRHLILSMKVYKICRWIRKIAISVHIDRPKSTNCELIWCVLMKKRICLNMIRTLSLIPVYLRSNQQISLPNTGRLLYRSKLTKNDQQAAMMTIGKNMNQNIKLLRMMPKKLK